MADSEPKDFKADDPVIKARHLQELLKGRITEEEALKLLRLHANEIFSAADYALTADNKTLFEELNVDITKLDPVTVEEVRQSLDMGLSIEKEKRQFGCGDCDRFWWRTVPVRKMVSICFRCKKKFDALPRDKEFGWGEFHCLCGNTFSGYAVMGQTSPCYKCTNQCFPERIVPPDNSIFRQTRSSSSHYCNAPNCFRRRKAQEHVREVQNQYGNNTGQHVNLAVVVSSRQAQECVHPKSKRMKNVVNASMRHVSTGSTVATFLSFTVEPVRPGRPPGLSDIESGDEENTVFSD